MKTKYKNVTTPFLNTHPPQKWNSLLFLSLFLSSFLSRLSRRFFLPVAAIVVVIVFRTLLALLLFLLLVREGFIGILFLRGFAFMPLVTFLFAPPLPNSTALTCAANFNEHDVSSLESSSGLTLTNINVFPSPPKQGANKYVNFELRYGTCFALLPSAAKTSPNDDKLLLIAHASFKRSPLAPDLATRSLPAKSTRFKAPDNVEPLAHVRPRRVK